MRRLGIMEKSVQTRRESIPLVPHKQHVRGFNPVLLQCKALPGSKSKKDHSGRAGADAGSPMPSLCRRTLQGFALSGVGVSRGQQLLHADEPGAQPSRTCCALSCVSCTWPSR